MRFLPFATLSLCAVRGLIAQLQKCEPGVLAGFLVAGVASLILGSIYVT